MTDFLPLLAAAGGAVGGAVLGVVVDRAASTSTRPLLRRWRLFRSRKLYARYRDGEILQHDGHRLFVSQFTPAGYDAALVQTRMRPTAPLSELLESSDLDAGVVLEEVERVRHELSTTAGRWNGRHLALREASFSRTGDLEEPGLDLVFEESDHAAYVGVKRLWVEHLRSHDVADVLPGDNLRRVQPALSHSFGLNATVETADGQLVVTRRSAYTSSFANRLHTSVNEGMAPQDRDRHGCPDPYATLLRGLHEELGIDCGSRALALHTLMLDIDHYEWGLLGHVDLRDTSWTWDALVARRQVGAASDSWESTTLEAVPFSERGILTALGRKDSWIPHGRLNVVLSGIYRFPRSAGALLAAY